MVFEEQLALEDKQASHSPAGASKRESGSSGSSVRLNRIFILDTNVLIHDANAFFEFKGVVIGIPFIVLEELDTFKKERGEKGRNAREAIRSLDDLRVKGQLGEGVPLNHNTEGSILRVLATPQDVDFSFTGRDIHDVKDNLIIQTAKNLISQGNQVTIVSKDINVRVKSNALGLDAEDYTKGKINYDSFYKGWVNVPVPALDLKNMTSKKIGDVVSNHELWPNEFIILESENNPFNNKVFRYLGNKNFKEVEQIRIMNSFMAKNIQQLMALDLLMDDDVKLVTLLGPAGTGKTFLTLLVGLYKVAYERMYRKFLVTRPVIALGADIGYLPGDIQEKLHYWMQPIHDNLEFIFSQMLRGSEEHFNLGSRRDRERKNEREQEQGKKSYKKAHNQENGQGESHTVERLQQKGILSLEAITYMRGRSIPFQFVFIDEVQNLTPHEVKTIVSRAGEGTKVILAGDPYQIDSPYLDFTSNGLTVTADKFKDQSISGTVFLETSERSELAKLAAEIL